MVEWCTKTMFIVLINVGKDLYNMYIKIIMELYLNILQAKTSRIQDNVVKN